MIYLGLAFAAYVIVSLWYIRKLHSRLQTHEQAWSCIEEIADHNKDGDVVVHVKHLEEQ